MGFTAGSNKHSIFYFFTASIVILVVLPDLLRHGMFMDGVQYACVSRSLAEGKASFWLPFLSSAWEKQRISYFLEHPPLVYYLQSWFFVLCNSGFLSERLYCIATLVASIFFIQKIWKLVFENNEERKRLWWLPVLLFISIPTVAWSFKNNMQENTVSVFVLAASFFGLKAAMGRKQWLNVCICAVCILLGALSKGLPGLFPIGIFIVYALVFKKPGVVKILLYTLLLVVIPSIILFLFWKFNSEARYSLEFYVSGRLVDRITNHPEVGNRFTILWWVVTDMLIPLAVSALVLVLFRWKKVKEKTGADNKKQILFFALFALCGIIPLTFTQVQRAVYFVPAMPFAVMALAIFLSKGLRVLMERINENSRGFKTTKIISVIVLIVSLVICVVLYGKPNRDAEMIAETYRVAEKTGTGRIIGTSYNVYYKWDLQFYFQRYHRITLQPLEGEYEFLLLEKGAKKSTEGFLPVEQLGQDLTLYQRSN